ncbi:MAG: HxlR family transcriptional regulator [Pseudonocardiales bacterium]|nr:HxlR family transcriptional regulator [Pseudonocardiales bacterium]
MPAVDIATAPCTMGRAAAILGDRWTLLIMRSAILGRTRFEQFKTVLGIADNILSNRLAKLVAAGLLNREPYQDGGRTRYHYPITEAGLALRPIMEAFAVWGHIYADPSAPATTLMSIVHTPCGQTTTNSAYCPTCKEPITDGDVAWLMPWLSPDPMPLATAH